MATVFTPDLADLYVTMGVCGLLFLGLTFFAFRAGKLKNVDPRRRVLLPMLAYFAALLALMGFLGSFWSSQKFPTVSVRNDQVSLDGERVELPPRGAIRLETNTGPNAESSTVRVLILQTRDRRHYAFPSDRYDVNEMMRVLRGR